MRCPPVLRTLSLLVPLGLAWFSVAPACGEGLVSNGGFEEGVEGKTPPGWSSWGTTRGKTMGTFVRDTTRPHSGKACLKIHNPADTTGYVVTAPKQALRPQAGKAYVVSFWARADREGESTFSLTGYSSIEPYVDAPISGMQRLKVGPEWKPFRFEYHEGWDFQYDRQRYILLTFKANAKSEARTLWIDDVTVSEEPGRMDGVLREDRLTYDPLAHRLQAGERLEFTVDAARRLSEATRAVGGISFHRVCGWTGQPYDKKGNYTLHPSLERAIRELRLPMTRFYAVGDEPFGTAKAIDKVVEVCRRVGVSPASVPLELESQGAEAAIGPEAWAEAVRYAKTQGYGFRYWEVTNEPYVQRPGEKAAFPTPDDYIAHVQACAPAIRAAQPDAQVGINIHGHYWKWCNYVLKRAAGSYDFVAPHLYAFPRVDRNSFEDVVLTANYEILDRALKINALLRAYNPGRDVYQYDTEWGLHSSGEGGQRADYVDRNANIYGTVHRAVRLIYYAREGMLRGASSWQMLSSKRGQGFGILSQDEPEKRFLLYWLYYHFNRHVGRWVLDTRGTAPFYQPKTAFIDPKNAARFAGPYTPVLATLSDDAKTVYLVLANGSWDRSFPFAVALRNFTPQRATAILLKHDDPDGKPLLERQEDALREFPVTLKAHQLRGDLPPHSVVFIAVAGQ